MIDATLGVVLLLAAAALIIVEVHSCRYKRTHGTDAWAQSDPFGELPLLAVVGSTGLILSLRHHHILGAVLTGAGLWLLLTLEVARLLREKD